MRVLALLLLAVSCHAAEYNRSDYGRWIDADKDCQNTRAEVLSNASESPVHGCVITSGTWVDPYTGEVFTDASGLDIDHIVPLKVIHDRAGYAWTRERKRWAYNAEVNLTVSSARANRQKGAKGLSEWLPAIDQCTYANEYLMAAEVLGVPVTEAEFEVHEEVCE